MQNVNGFVLPTAAEATVPTELIQWMLKMELLCPGTKLNATSSVLKELEIVKCPTLLWSLYQEKMDALKLAKADALKLAKADALKRAKADAIKTVLTEKGMTIITWANLDKCLEQLRAGDWEAVFMSLETKKQSKIYLDGDGCWITQIKMPSEVTVKRELYAETLSPFMKIDLEKEIWTMALKRK